MIQFLPSVIGKIVGLHAPFLECSSMARDTGLQSKVESCQGLKKGYLIPPCLTLSIV